jgi:hypothetical protein
MKITILRLVYSGVLHALLALALLKSDFITRVESRIARMELVGRVESAPGIKREYKYSPRSADAAIEWQQALRGVLAERLGITDELEERTPEGKDIEVVQLKTEQRKGLDSLGGSDEERFAYTIEELRLSRGSDTAINVIVTIPLEAAPPFPAVVLIAGHSGSMHTPYESATGYFQIGRELAEKGFVTISTSVSDHSEPPPTKTLIGSRLLSLLTCVDYLETIEVVDKDRIGCVGKSLGGEMAMWLAAFDQRIRATVSSGFLTTMTQLLSFDHCPCWNFPGLTDVAEFADVYSLIAPRPLQCQNGIRESVSGFPVRIAQPAFREIQLIYKDFGATENLEFVTFDGGHEIGSKSLILFLQNQLGKVTVVRKP